MRKRTALKMRRSKGIALIGFLLLSTAPAANITTAYTVQVNGHPNGQVTLRWFDGVPYIGVNDSAKLFWYPQFDPDHNIIDFADCIRLDFTGKAVYASGGAQSGWAAVFTNQPPLAHNVRRDLVPLLDVAPRLAVRVTLDPRRHVLTANSTPERYVAQYPYLDSCRRTGVP